MATAAGNATRLCLVNRLTANTTAEMHSQAVDSGLRTKQNSPARLKASPNRWGSFKPTRPTSKAAIQISQHKHAVSRIAPGLTEAFHDQRDQSANCQVREEGKPSSGEVDIVRDD